MAVARATKGRSSIARAAGRCISSVGAGTSTNPGTPSAPRRYTPSSTRQCRWILRLAAEPKRWISVTAPLSASSGLSPAWPGRCLVIMRCMTCSTSVTRLGCAASSKRSGMGSRRPASARQRLHGRVKRPAQAPGSSARSAAPNRKNCRRLYDSAQSRKNTIRKTREYCSRAHGLRGSLESHALRDRCGVPAPGHAAPASVISNPPGAP